MLNQGSRDLGRQNAPKKTEFFLKRIDELYKEYLLKNGDKASHKFNTKNSSGICRISRMITVEISKEGYSGSERTVRDYLRSRFYVLKTDTQE